MVRVSSIINTVFEIQENKFFLHVHVADILKIERITQFDCCMYVV